MSRDLNLQDLLEAGAHFGHQTHKWNPKMKNYVFGERNGIYIIDLNKTVDQAKKAYDFLRRTASEGRPILFVGCKRQAAEAIRKAATTCGAYHVTSRWLGGMLTNYKTVSLSIDKLRKVEKMKETGDFALLTKKERSKIDKEVAKLEKNLGGIKDMRKLPGAVFVVDPTNERIAVKEANTLRIPVIAITDTNCDPSGIEYVVPGNDDAIKSIEIFVNYFANAVSEGGANMKRSKGGTPDKDEALEREMIGRDKGDRAQL
jgi:small subunit ribosomal protein S2